MQNGGNSHDSKRIVHVILRISLIFHAHNSKYILSMRRHLGLLRTMRWKMKKCIVRKCYRKNKLDLNKTITERRSLPNFFSWIPRIYHRWTTEAINVESYKQIKKWAWFRTQYYTKYKMWNGILQLKHPKIHDSTEIP